MTSPDGTMDGVAGASTAIAPRPRAGGVPEGSPVVVVLGPPGAGKGTQCGRLAQATGWAHVSLGDALRREIDQGSDLGARVRDFVEQGALVPDELAVEAAARLLALHATGAGILFDGFPRTIRQAEAFDDLAPDALRLCIVLVAPRGELVGRLAARGRHDDRASTIRRRLLSYGRDTQLVIAAYAERGLVCHVDARAPAARITEHLRLLILAATAAGRRERFGGHDGPVFGVDADAARAGPYVGAVGASDTSTRPGSSRVPITDPHPLIGSARSPSTADADHPLPCGDCGFEVGATPPEMLVAAVMRIPGQYRAVFDRHGSLEEIDTCLRERSGPAAWSVLEQLAHVADGLHLAARNTVMLLDGGGHFSPIHAETPRSGSNRWPIPAVLGSLHAGASALGRALSQADPDEWNRSRPVGDHLITVEITVRQLVDDALHEAAHHLVDVERSLDPPCRATR